MVEIETIKNKRAIIQKWFKIFLKKKNHIKLNKIHAATYEMKLSCNFLFFDSDMICLSYTNDKN